MKPISFRPSAIDNMLLDRLLENGYKDKSDVIRKALKSLAIAELGTDEVSKILLNDLLK